VLEYPNGHDVAVPSRAIHLRTGRPTTDSVVRLGVIGAGQFAKGILLPEFRKHRDVQFVGVCTVSGLTSRSPAERYGAQFATSDAMEILGNERINTIVVATRHDQHADLVAAAAARGESGLLREATGVDRGRTRHRDRRAERVSINATAPRRLQPAVFPACRSSP
jgi:polar amino acid transport system substrate-binding protein